MTHFRKIPGFALAMLLAVAIHTSPLRADEAPRIFVFGDSLSDSGRLYAEYGLFMHPSFGEIYVNPAFSSGTGAFSNGPVWTEYLARSRKATVVNYAYSGAGTGFYGEPARMFALPPDALATGELPTGVRSQVDEFLSDPARPLLGPDDLVVVWAGANNYFFGGALPEIDNNPFTVVEDLLTSVFLLSEAAGARTIIIPNLPDLSRLPLRFDIPAPLNAQLGQAARAHNAILDAFVRELRPLVNADLIMVDIFTAFDQIISQPARFGFSNVSDSCVLVLPPAAFLSGACVNASGSFDPAGFMFWDRVHPTTKTHAIVAQFVDVTIRTTRNGIQLVDAPVDVRAKVARAHMQAIAGRLNRPDTAFAHVGSVAP